MERRGVLREPPCITEGGEDLHGDAVKSGIRNIYLCIMLLQILLKANPQMME